MSDFNKAFGDTLGPLGFPQQDRQASQLDALLKSLPKDEEHQYRHLTLAKAPTEVNPGERSDVSWISTESVDRSREIVISKGMDNSQFMRNPLVTLGHAYYLPPVGKSLWQKKVKDGDTVGIKAKTQYPSKPKDWPEGEPWASDKVFLLVQAGLMQGKSIGFLPIKARRPEPKEIMKNDWPENTIIFEEWLLLEYACCFLPVNQEALVEQVSKGLELPTDFIKAMGLEGINLKHNPPPPPPVPPAPTPVILSHRTLAEAEKYVESRIQQLDVAQLVQNTVKATLERMRGKV